MSRDNLHDVYNDDVIIDLTIYTNYDLINVRDVTVRLWCVNKDALIRKKGLNSDFNKTNSQRKHKNGHPFEYLNWSQFEHNNKITHFNFLQASHSQGSLTNQKAMRMMTSQLWRHNSQVGISILITPSLHLT